MSNYSRRLDKLEPRPHHNERVEEAGRRIYEWLFQERDMILQYGPPPAAQQQHLNEMARYTNDFQRKKLRNE